MQKKRSISRVVQPRSYRAPEVILLDHNYNQSIDIFGLGCILAELLLRIPFIAGDTDLDQLAKIFQALGTPTVENWPGHTELPDFVQFKSYPTTPLDDIFTAAGPDLIGNNRVTLEIKD